jgi:hypothetical protein
MRRTTLVYNILIQTDGGGIADDGSQNVHDTVVRNIGAEKYLYLQSQMEEKYKHIGPDWCIKLQGGALYEFKKYKEFEMLYQKLMMLEEFVFYTHRGEIKVTELEVFALVWFGFKTLDKKALFTQLQDCYEDGNLICLNGRIARYLTSFVGLTDNILGKTEITEKIIFEEALREVKKLLEAFLEKTPELKKIYESGGTGEEEEKLEFELFKLKNKFKSQLKEKYPQLDKKKIEELVSSF